VLTSAYAHELSVAVRAAREAGATALRMQGAVSSTSKADGSPVTQGDLAAEAVIRHHLTLAFPADAILSEEAPDDPAARVGRPRLWIADPIDGTRDYLAGSAEWAVQLALAVDGRLALGVLDLPGEDLCLVGVPGRGAWIIDARGERPLALESAGSDRLITSQSKRNRDAVARIAAALPEFTALHATSVGVKVWRILAGTAGLYVHPRGIAEWDAAAPAAVLTAAGGHATDLAGKPLRFNTPEGRCPGLVFSKRADHAELIARMLGAGVELVP
jgi:3'-phosphoadenosine 5'-phosphosulfate (PAPS) 3'-phosphatase